MRAIFALAITCSAISTKVEAEGNCPPGYYQLPGPTQGVINCGPVPGDNASEAEAGPRWASRWGAIAIDEGESNVGVGAAAAMSSKRKAIQAALAECRGKGGQKCEISLIYDNQCAVVIAGVGYSRSHGGATVEIAATRGLKMCNEAGTSQCQVYYKACSLPQQIQ
ncbi:protein of unknown function [Lysobacter sp. cf310]|nr:protein of unknown function [Lysobacter sp. cf310]